MKLRSGKIIGKKELPVVLQQELDDSLLDFKELLVDHIEVAIEVLEMIAAARSFNRVYEIRHIFREAEIQDENHAIGVTYGSLVALIIGQHNFYSRQNIDAIYHDEIKERMLAFIDTSLVGDQIEGEM